MFCFVLQDSAKAALDEVTRTLWCLKEETNQNYIPLTSHQEALNRVKDEEERVCHVPEQLFMGLSSTSTSWHPVKAFSCYKVNFAYSKYLI